MMQTLVIACSVSMIWWCVGYSLCFSPSMLPVIGGFGRAFLMYENDAMMNDVPESVFCMFQLTFAIITPAIVTGAVAERTQLWPLMLFAVLWVPVVYCPI